MLLPTLIFLSLFAALSTAAPSRLNDSSAHKRYLPLPALYSDARARSASSSFAHLVNPRSAPLTRIAVRNARNAHLHPYMLFQQHLNRAHRRRALMAGRAPPSTEELAGLLQKRWESIGGQDKLRMRKRQRQTVGAGGGGANRLIGQPGEAIPNNKAVWAPVGNARNAKVDSRIAALANAAGFPQEALAAAQAGTVDKAITPTAAQTSGEDIEVSSFASFGFRMGADCFSLGCQANDVGAPSRMTRPGDLTHSAMLPAGYFTTVQMGTPPKDYRLLVDSGSSGASFLTARA